VWLKSEAVVVVVVDWKASWMMRREERKAKESCRLRFIYPSVLVMSHLLLLMLILISIRSTAKYHRKTNLAV